MSEYVYEPEKCTEIIELDISDEEFLLIAKVAHRLDITFNHFINLALHQEMKRIEAMSEKEKEEYTAQARETDEKLAKSNIV